MIYLLSIAITAGIVALSLFLLVGKKIKLGISTSMLLVPLWVCTLYFAPIYNVWQKGLAGEAELRQADWNRQIAVREAAAKKESAVALADAEIERARGVAEANKIIGESLKGNEGYLRYLWIEGLQHKDNNTIYVPTEAGLPILEAGKR